MIPSKSTHKTLSNSNNIPLAKRKITITMTTYKSFKKNFLIGFCITVSTQVSSSSAFQPISFSTSANVAQVHGCRRRPLATTTTSAGCKYGFSLGQECITAQTNLYYKNLDDYEEQQPISSTTTEVGANIGIDNENGNGSSNMPLLKENKDVLSNTAITTTALPSAIDLPRSFFIKANNNEAQSNNNTKLQEFMLSSEMFIGRIAMIMALYLLTEEILTGSSVLDQLQYLFN